jgi:hypothetical protein
MAQIAALDCQACSDAQTMVTDLLGDHRLALRNSLVFNAKKPLTAGSHWKPGLFGINDRRHFAPELRMTEERHNTYPLRMPYQKGRQKMMQFF